MSKVWKIYRQGTSSNPVAEVHELELHDEWMGECFLTVSVKSAEPVDFAVGDYIDYRDERYVIEYDPTVLKKARSGSYGEGFTYDNIKFVNEAQAKIVRCDFTDIVLYDNGQHYTSLPTFPFYCETVDDLLDRIQANLNELYDKDFIIIGMDNARNQQRANVKGNGSKAQSEYEKWIGGGSSDYGSKGVALTVDNINCWDALAKVHSDFGLNFIVRGYTIIVGTAGMFTQHNFTYGKGNGLYEVERIGDSEQQIVTRLRAYGAETNLPLNYYANLYKKPILKGFRNKEKSEIAGRDWFYGIKTNILWDNVKGAFNQNADSAQCQVSYNGVTATAWVVTRTNGVDNGPQYLYLSFITDNDQDIAFYNALGDDSEKTMDILSGVKKEKWPSSLMESIGGYNYPAALVINRLMLPGFPDTDLHTWVASNRASLLTEGFEFSTNAERPYIDSPNTALYGIRPGSIYFDGNNDTTDIHPTITGSGYDEIVSATQVDDQGVFNDKDPDPITIVIPGMGDFKLDEAWKENESSIDITDGMCGGRSFQIVKVPKKVDGNWECQCKRAKDDTLHLWFPYCDFQINANGRSDHFVLTGIDLPDEYVRLASERLFDAAIEALRKNDAPRFTYQPRIDEIWMQRQDDLAKASQADDNVSDIPSIHDTLKAGDIFRFADGDIMGVDENDQPIVNSIIIDVLTIKENGNNGIPTYEVTLRDEKQVSTIQKIQNKVDSLVNGGNGIGSGGEGGSSMTNAQIESLISSAGEDLFISKQNDDRANGLITFLKGIKIGLQRLFGWDANGNITANDISARTLDVERFSAEKFQAEEAQLNTVRSDNYNYDNGMNGTGFILTKFGANGHAFLAIDDLVVRGKMTVNTLEIREETYTGGNQHWSPAGSIIFRVDFLGAGDVPIGMSVVSTPWLLNGEPFMTVENDMLTQIAYATRKQIQETIGSAISTVEKFRCYIIADNGSTTTRNFWCIGDQARCQTYNIVSRDKRDGETATGAIQSMDPLADVPLAQKDGEKTMENVYYWRLVVGVGTAKLEDGKTYNYIDLSNRNSSEKQGYVDGSDIPAAGDTIVCFGNDRNTDRMGLVSIETYNSANELQTDETPAIKMYAGVNTFSLNGKRTGIISPGKVEFNTSIFRLVTYDGKVTPVFNQRGAWVPKRPYYYYDLVQHNGSSWYCIVTPVFYWFEGDKRPWEYTDAQLDQMDIDSMKHRYADGILNSGEEAMDGAKGHPVGDTTTVWTLVYNFTTAEPSEESDVWAILAQKGDPGDMTVEEIEEIVDREIREAAQALKDGLTVMLSPQVLIYNQDTTSSATFADANHGQRTAVSIYRGTSLASYVVRSATAYGVTSGGDDYRMDGCAANDGTHVWLTNVPFAMDANTGYYTYQYDHGYIEFTVQVDPGTADAKTYAFQVAWYLNRLGSREEVIKGDTKTEIMSRTEYSVSAQDSNLLRNTKNPDASGSGWYITAGQGSIVSVSGSPVDGYSKAFRVVGASGTRYWTQTGSFWRNSDTYKFGAYVRGIGGTVNAYVQVIKINTPSPVFTNTVYGIPEQWTYITFDIKVPGYVETYDENGQLTSSADFCMGISGSGTIEYIAPILNNTTSLSVIRSDYDGKIESSAKGVSETFTEQLSETAAALQDSIDGKVSNGTFETFQRNVGEYERTASENMSKLSRRIYQTESDNLLLNTMNPTYGDGTGGTWDTNSTRYATIVPNVTDSPVDGYNTLFRVTSIQDTASVVWRQRCSFWSSIGSYVFSVYARMTSGEGHGYVRVWQYATTGASAHEVFIKNDISIDDTWTQVLIDITVPTYTDVDGSTGSFQFGIYGEGIIEYIAPRLVSVTGESVISSQIRQTADNINLSIKSDLMTTGIDITNGTVDIQANKFSVHNSDGEKTLGVNANGDFEVSGTIMAYNLFRNLCIVTGWTGSSQTQIFYSTNWYYCNGENDNTRRYGYEQGKYYENPQTLDYMVRCTYKADIITLRNNSSYDWPSNGAVYLPRPQDFPGKTIEVIHNATYGNHDAYLYVCDGGVSFADFQYNNQGTESILGTAKYSQAVEPKEAMLLYSYLFNSRYYWRIVGLIKST